MASRLETRRRKNSLIWEGLRTYWKWVLTGLAFLLLTDLLELFPPLLIKDAVDTLVAHGSVNELVKLAAVYGFLTLFQALGRWGWRFFLIRASMFAGRDLRHRFARHLFGMSASFYDKRRVGDLLSLATSDAEAVRMAIGPGLLTLADSIFYLATVPIAMLWLSPELALLAMAPLPLIPWWVVRNERKIHEHFLKMQEQFGKIAASAQESLNGVRVLKGFAKEDVQLQRFGVLGEEYRQIALKLSRVQTAFAPGLDFFMSLSLVLLLAVGGHWVIDDAVTLGTFVAFQRYIQKMVWPMTALGMAVTYYQRAVASSERILDVVELKADVSEPAEVKLPAGFSPTGWKTAGKVKLDNLTFRFPQAPLEALKEVSVTIEAGERVAFVGTIGSGKSALLSLLPRLYPVHRGMLSIDDVDINDWPLEELRKQVGYVAQDVFLFSDTVVENVGLGLQPLPRELNSREVGAARDRILPYTQQAAVHDEVQRLSKAYLTRLGDRGANLSGGQKQRLTIARALAKQPSVLVLDDALSAVDVQTEENILHGLRARAGRNTEIIAAHRISTVREANRIVVLDRGRVRQIGTHAQLLEDRRGLYRKFYEQQQLKEEIDSYDLS